jgi:hypothetical protein
MCVSASQGKMKPILGWANPVFREDGDTFLSRFHRVWLLEKVMNSIVLVVAVSAVATVAAFVWVCLTAVREFDETDK